MNLLHYTNRNLSLVILLLMALWGTVFYFLIIHEVMDETDDTLANTREIVVGKVLAHPEILQSNDSIMQRYAFRQITPEEAVNYRETYYDSTLYIVTEDEFEPIRVMKTCFRTADDRFYELELRISTLERDDMVRAIWWALVALYVVVMLCIMVGTRFVLHQVFRPLRLLLDWLERLTPGKSVPPLNQESPVREFRILNAAALDMARRAQTAYEEQKQFIENASHELQTPLAVIRGKLELLADTEGMTETQLQYIGDMFETLARVVKLNKSLLLLSRISNGQFTEKVPVDINRLASDMVRQMEELYEERGIRCVLHETGACIAEMDESLARVLIGNLIRNAMGHSKPGQEATVLVAEQRFTVMNCGEKPLDANLIFRRFYQDPDGKKESNGLGLAIVKSIAECYQVTVNYRFEAGKHIFELIFVK